MKQMTRLWCACACASTLLSVAESTDYSGPAYRIAGAGKKAVDERSMPGGLPNTLGFSAEKGGGGGTDGRAIVARACAALGRGAGRELGRLRDEVGKPLFVERCQALSGMLARYGLRRRLRSCAVVGGSGILRKYPKGREIEAHEAIIRVNNCPVKGFEAMVGGRTSVRFVNEPLSLKWWRDVKKNRKKVAPELLNNDHVVVWGAEEMANGLRAALPRNSSVVRADTRFRRQCAEKTFWSSGELATHTDKRFEITFGFEAVAHALYACERVSLYGFFLDHSDKVLSADGKTLASARAKTPVGVAAHTPYHYYENASFDKLAVDPTKPWTYRFHNFELEHTKYRQLEAACWLRIVTA